MNVDITITTPPLLASLLDDLTIFDCDNFKEQFDTTIKIKTRLKSAQTKQIYKQAFIRSRMFEARILDNVSIQSGDSEVSSVIFSFTQGDLDNNNKLRRTHNFNQAVVDASVFNNTGGEIMVALEVINNNTIELDFNRVDVQGVWKLLIEK